MRLFTCFLLLTFSAVISAKDLDFRGIPADHALVFTTGNLNGLQVVESQEAKALIERIKKLTATEDSIKLEKEIHEAIKLATGIDPETKDIRYSAGFSFTLPDISNFGIILHFRHDSEKLAAHASAKKVQKLTANKTAGWHAAELLKSIRPEFAEALRPLDSLATAPNAPKLDGPIGIFDYDPDTLIIAPAKEAARMIALLKGTGTSYTLPTELAKTPNMTGRPYFVMALNADKFPQNPQLTLSGFRSVVVALGEDKTKQVLFVTAKFNTPEQAGAIGDMTKQNLAMIPKSLAANPNEPQSIEDQEKMAIGLELFAGIQPVEVKDNLLNISGQWPNARIFAIFEKLLEAALPDSPITPKTK